MIGNRIKQLRTENNLTQKQLADKLHVGKTTISNYETGYSQPDIETQNILADLFDVSVDYLLGRDNTKSKNKDYITINVYGKVPAGIPIEAIEDIEDTEDLSLKDYNPTKEYMGLVVDGDSMYPKYLKGDTIIIEVTPCFESGEDCVVYVNGYDATLKTVIKNPNGTITLRPINTAYSPKTYGPNDETIRILGVVKEIRRKI